MQNTSHTRTARDLPETLQNFHNYNKALGQAMLVVWEGGARKETARLNSQSLSSNSLTNERKLQWQIRATCGSV